MLRALLHTLEPGRICDIVQPGNEFEVHENFYWVDVPNDTTTSDKYNEDGTITKFNPWDVDGFTENAYKVARAIAYTDVGNQLDMLYRELRDTGTISTDGQWFNHIANIKTSIPKDDPMAVYQWNVAQWEAYQAGQLDPNAAPTSGNVAPG